MSSVLKSAVAASLLAMGSAHASTVTFESASSFGPDQVDADAYRMVVNQALTSPAAFAAVVPTYDNLTSQAQFGGFNNNLALRTTVTFGVTAADAGTWAIRVGGDFGYGGAVFLDGVALGYKSTSMWWNFGYADATQSFQFASVAVGAGNHTLQVFALEDCCDGGQQGQFSINGGSYKTFGSNDGLAASVVSEPQTYALMLAGVLAIGLYSSRNLPRRTGAAG